MWQDVLAALIQIAVVVATPFILWFVNKLLKILEKKLDMELSEKEEKAIKEAIEEGIALAEQAALNALKKGNRLKPEEKKKIAFNHVKNLLDDKGIDVTGIIEDRIEGAVGRLNVEKEKHASTKSKRKK